jgi:zinc transporter ZupT
VKYIQTFFIGAIAVLAVSLIPHIFESVAASVFSLILLFIVLLLARKVGDHFHHGHTHEGDSNLDASIGVTLVVVNILHPLVDGFALYSTYSSQSRYLFASVLVGVVIHEIFRQSALAVVFKEFGFRAWKVVLPAIVGMTFGWLLGVVGGTLPEALKPYIDTLTFGAYVFIVSEHLFAHREVLKEKKHVYWLIFGIVLATIFITFFKAH